MLLRELVITARLSRALVATRGGGASWPQQRTLASAAAATVQEAALPDAEADIKAARERYRSHALAFYDIDPATLEFAVGQARGVGGVPVALPTITVPGSTEPDVRHLVPWSVVVASSFGPWGNLGKKKFAGDGLIDNPMEASQEIGVASVGLYDSEEENQELVEYTKVWLDDVSTRLVQFTVKNIAQFPDIQRKFKGLDAAALSTLLTNGMQLFNVEGSSQKEQQHKLVYFRSRLFFRGQEAPPANADPRDIQVWDQSKGRRVNVTLFERDGTRVPLAQRQLLGGDIAGIVARLQPFLLDGGLRLRRHLVSVTRLRQKSRPAGPGDSPASVGSMPYGSL